MSEAAPIPVVFDCTVFAQALINPKGPAGACLSAAQQNRLRLFISSYVIQEIRELPGKLPPRLGVTDERIEALIADLGKYADPVDQVPDDFKYARDPDDAHYVNLAIVTQAYLIVSRDRDLLALMNESDADGLALRMKHPQLRVITPPDCLQMLKEKEQP